MCASRLCLLEDIMDSKVRIISWMSYEHLPTNCTCLKTKALCSLIKMISIILSTLQGCQSHKFSVQGSLMLVRDIWIILQQEVQHTCVFKKGDILFLPAIVVKSWKHRAKCCKTRAEKPQKQGLDWTEASLSPGLGSNSNTAECKTCWKSNWRGIP